jgi:hypothetical protein
VHGPDLHAEKNIVKSVNNTGRFKPFGGHFLANRHRLVVVRLGSGQVAPHDINISQVMQTCRYGKAFGSELLRNRQRSSVVLLSLRQVATLISNETKAVQGSRKTESLAADRAGLFRLLLIIAICTSPIASFVERIRPSLQEKRENPRPGIGARCIASR